MVEFLKSRINSVSEWEITLLKAFKNFVGKSGIFNRILGEVVFETPSVKSETIYGYVAFRVKQNYDDSGARIGMKLRPDSYAGSKGSPTNYIFFDIDGALKLKEHLEQCIDEYHRLENVQSNAQNNNPIQR